MIATVLITLLVTGVVLFVVSVVIGVLELSREADSMAFGVFVVSLVLIAIPGILLTGMALANA